MDADLYAREDQVYSHATNNQDVQARKIDETGRKARLNKWILPKRHTCSKIKSGPTAQTWSSLPPGKEQKVYRPWKLYNARWTYLILGNVTMA